MGKHDQKRPNPPTMPVPTVPTLSEMLAATPAPIAAPVTQKEMEAMQQNAETMGKHATAEKKGPNSEEAHEALVAQLRADLAAAERERDELFRQLQPAHDAFGPRANARGVLVSCVEGSGEKGYDVGGKYRLALVAVEDGKVRISDAVDVIGGVVSSEMNWGLVKDHLDKRVADFVVPEAHRS